MICATCGRDITRGSSAPTGAGCCVVCRVADSLAGWRYTPPNADARRAAIWAYYARNAQAVKDAHAHRRAKRLAQTLWGEPGKGRNV